MSKSPLPPGNIAEFIKSLIETQPTANVMTITTNQYGADQTIKLTLYKKEDNIVDQVRVEVPGNCDFDVITKDQNIDTSQKGYPILANTEYNINSPPQTGSGKPSKKHVKTARQHTCKDGITRVVYTKNGKDYVKRKTRNGTFKYVKI